MQYREDLDKLAESNRKAPDELIKLNASCHPEASLTVQYWLEGGCAILQCVACGQVVAKVAVLPKSLEKVEVSAKAEAKASARPRKKTASKAKPRAKKKAVKKAQTRKKAATKGKVKATSKSPSASLPGPQKMGEAARRNRARVR